MTPEQIDGITKARLVANIANEAETYATNEDYTAFVCGVAGLAELPESAADSYAKQWADRAIAELEAELAEAMNQ